MVEEIEKVVQQLKERGWQEQKAGTIYYRGTLGTNLLKGKQVLTIVQESCPDMEFVQLCWGREAAAQRGAW